MNLASFDRQGLYAVMLVALFSSSAGAQQTPGVAAAVNLMSVSKEDCQRLLQGPSARDVAPRPGDDVAFRPGDDVAFRPGVDVRGNPVAPADAAPLGAISVPDEIVIDFGLDLAGRYGFGGAALFDATAGIATVQYDLGLGTLMLNGKPLRAEDLRAVKRACRLRLEPQRPGGPQ